MDREKLYWNIVLVVISPLILLSWVGAALIWPFKKVSQQINKMCSPWG